MNYWPIGLSTGCFYKINIMDILEDVRNCGISLIEVCSHPEHLDYHDENKISEARGLIDRLALIPYSMHAPFAEEIDITSLDDKKRDHSMNEIFQAAKAASLLGVMNFVIHPGPEETEKPPPEEHLQKLKNAAEAMNRVAEFCLKHRMNLVLENMLPHLLFGKTSDLLWIIGAVHYRNSGVCLDTGHASLSGELHTVLTRLSGHLKMIHAADNRGENDDHLAPGNGVIDWKRLIAGLRDVNFSGAIILELSGDENKPVPALQEDARRARRFIWDIAREMETGGIR